MSSVQCLREFINERLTAAAEEIFRVFENNIFELEEEINRQRKLLDIVWKPEVQLHRIELRQQRVCKEEEVLTDQQLFNQQRISSLDQQDPEPPQIKEEPEPPQIKEEPEPPQIKEEQEELCTSQDREQLVLKQETDVVMLTLFYGEGDHNEDQTLNPDESQSAAEEESVVHMSVQSSEVPEPNTDLQLLPHSSHVTERQDHKEDEHGDSGPTGNVETKPRKRRQTNKIHRNSVLISTISKISCSTQPELLQQHVCKEKEVLTDQQLFNQQRISSLDQENPEPPQIQEEQEELCTSQYREQPVVRQAASSLLPHSSHVAESQDHKEGEHGDSLSTGNAATKPQKRCEKSKNLHNPTMSETYFNTHKHEKSLKCDTCGKVFKKNYSLDRHVRTHTGERPYSCDVCGKTFIEPSTLKVHERSHTGERPYSCDFCGKRFIRISTLNAHIRIHTGEKPYSCDICGKTFSQQSVLNVHKRTHTGERPYSCDVCGKTFSQQSVLNIHRRTHTGERPYSCNICGKRFSQQSVMTVHRRIHTGEKPYPCDICGKTFNKICRMKAHKQHHTR
ncbi:zinc finger protein 235-like [Embiotoca jacksoni]|uniref:zinc finger protein 235-like n=1 Tax=Embiotoca jacksoni TaxID=100190 RepID=UPI003704C415